MTNARCLTEGVDIPAIDCVVFADPKQSRIDIVQAAGRALRRYSGKDYGYILLPLIIPSKMEFSEFAKTTAFRKVVHTITALSIQDERIVEEFRAIQSGRISKGKIIEIDGDVPVGSSTVDQSTTEPTAAEPGEPRAGTKGNADQSNPNQVYAETGWAGYGDWLGSGTIPTRSRSRRDDLIKYRAKIKIASRINCLFVQTNQ